MLVIVLMGIIAVAVTSVSGRLATQTAQALKLRQMLGVAHGLLEEVRHMPYTFCDPQDARFLQSTGAGTGGGRCQALADGMGPEPGETRYGNTVATRFDGVTDYDGFIMPGGPCAGLCRADRQPLIPVGNALTGCDALIRVFPTALPAIPAGNALLVRVTLRCPGEANIVAEAIRVRHAPNLDN